MRATIRRNSSTDFGVFGHLHLYGHTNERVGHWCSAEDDWRDNATNVSCIPAGRYHCRRTIYHKYGIPTFEITGVAGRSRILFHPGNTEEDTAGCVLLGKDFGCADVADEDDPQRRRDVKWAVRDSRTAFAEFMHALKGVNEFWLDVVWDVPGYSQAA